MEKYEQMQRIGKGSYGDVFLVKDKEKNRHYVMKNIILSSLTEKEKQEALNESKILSSLKHPNIISYVESIMTDGSLNIVMDYADGGDLCSVTSFIFLMI